MNKQSMKNRSEATQQTVKFFETLLRASTDGIVITDTTQNIIVVNEAFCSIFGSQWGDMVETSLFLWLEQLDSGALNTWGKLEARVRTEGACRNTEFMMTIPDGVNYYSVNASLLDQVADEESGVIISIWRDVTDFKRTQAMLQQYAKELEMANEEVKQFAYIISHDLRAPLVNIKGFSAELRYGLDEINSVMESAIPHLDEKQKESVNIALEEDIPEAFDFIESSVNRMDSFINSLLRLSRLGRHELKPVEVNIRSVVEAVLKDIAHQIEERKTRVTMGSLPSVIADQTAMEQIIGNLLNNAVKYWEPERPLEIEIMAETSQNETVIHVRDNGRGIAKDDMDKVFAPFRRAGEENVPGDGMGLAYVQTMVRRHGGRIKCESEHGAGTTFTFSISKRISGL
ncbi:PAS domain-containing sensor histidine kinase [Desulfococcaceae bacterium HSG8]|nr:PAS domain-containing sensor histidine kinase [Desulfococcaceae bacterium HSG8]